MRFKLEDIPEEGLEVALDGQSPLLQAVLGEVGDASTPASISGRLRLMPVSGDTSVWVDGQMVADLHKSCDRCLEPVIIRLDESVQVLVNVRAALVGAGPDDQEHELDADSLDVSFYDPGDGIQVDQIVREQLLLGLPSVVLCSSSCQGICQRCGVDLNKDMCQCAEDVVDPRFAALANLKLS